MTTWTTTTKSPMSVSEIDALFAAASSIEFASGVNFAFRDAATNSFTPQSKS